MPNVLVLGKIHRAGIDRLAAADCAITELPDHPADLPAQVGETDAIIVRMTRIDSAVIEAAPDLRIVARHGVGYEAVDLAALT
ncbi:MAG: hypothetical protein JSU82_10270, partial [Rhodospirillales bacterium]